MGPVAEGWLRDYRLNFDAYRDAAKEVKKQLEDALAGRALGVQLIDVRAKEPDSAEEKIARKAYGRPATQMTDIIAARVVTLFDHTVTETVELLRKRFSVVERHTEDKTRGLRPREVGYRSTHLVIKPKVSGLEPVRRVLASLVVEVQVRSTIAHAWAEIEHTFRYKAGTGVPEAIQRRFDALAGTLELVDREFSAIAEALVEHIAITKVRYQQGLDHDSELTALSLLSAVAYVLADAPPLGPDGLHLEVEDAHRMAEVLRRVGVANVGEFEAALRSSETLDVLRRYEEATGREVERASALIYIGAIVGLKDFGVLSRLTKISDPDLMAAVSGA